jgi:hypothetical protein
VAAGSPSIRTGSFKKTGATSWAPFRWAWRRSRCG